MNNVYLFAKYALVLLTLSLTACANFATQSELQQGKRYFENGYYKRAMHELLPLASDGNANAQYAVGYMYYYGYGVAQDTEVGYFWVNRSAAQRYEPAMQALKMMQSTTKEQP